MSTRHIFSGKTLHCWPGRTIVSTAAERIELFSTTHRNASVDLSHPYWCKSVPRRQRVATHLQAQAITSGAKEILTTRGVTIGHQWGSSSASLFDLSVPHCLMGFLSCCVSLCAMSVSLPLSVSVRLSLCLSRVREVSALARPGKSQGHEPPLPRC